MEEVYRRARRVRLAIFDVDGVLTDGSLYISDSGEEFKAFYTQDGHGMKMLKATGVELAIITGRTSRCVELRAQNLNVGLLYQGVEDKLAAFHDLVQRFGVAAEATAYVGDDVVDVPVMRACGLAICVPEAPPNVKRHAHLVTRMPGGRGAVREVCELIMQAQDSLAAQLARYQV